jgi:hypothetical protein
MTTEVVSTLERESQAMAVQVQAMAITDADTYAAAGEWLRTVAAYLKKVNEVMGPIVQAAHRAHQVAVQQRDALLRPAEGAKRILGERMAAWETEQRRRAQEAAAAARREQERLEAEARAAALAAEARLRKEAEDQRLAEAAQLEQRGDAVGASKLLEAPVPVPVVTPAPVFAPAPPVPVAPKVEGVSYRDDYDFEIFDPGQIPREYLVPDEKKIRAVVKAMRASALIPGVRVFVRRVPSVRAS